MVTGGAGFIGSNIVEELLKLGATVRVLDNLSTGFMHNIESFMANPLFEFIEGDICIYEDCLKAVEGVDAITHQAALGSVPRSIAHPELTHATNATGFLNMLRAANEKGVKRFVYASSSSVYGDSDVSPKTIGSEGNLLSPYAVTKHLNEEYAKVYARLHGLETIGMRYFNVFGPKQNPNGVYAAAIPKFVEAMRTGGEIIINGDGEQSRDFTYVKNAVKANLLALSTSNEEAYGRVFNIACGDSFTLNTVIECIKSILLTKEMYHPNTTILYGPERKGDIQNSLADIELTKTILGYEKPIEFRDGMQEFMNQIPMNQGLNA